MLLGIIANFKKRKEFKEIIERFELAYRETPSLVRYQKLVLNEWWGIGEASINCKDDLIKKVLPLKSLAITSKHSNCTYIKFDKVEFSKVLNNKVNNRITYFLDKYTDNLSKTQQYEFYFSNKETITLLLDAILNKYYLEDSDSVLKLMEYLCGEMDNIGLHTMSKEDIKQRMEIELEFIKRRKEAEKFEFN